MNLIERAQGLIRERDNAPEGQGVISHNQASLALGYNTRGFARIGRAQTPEETLKGLKDLAQARSMIEEGFGPASGKKIERDFDVYSGQGEHEERHSRLATTANLSADPGILKLQAERRGLLELLRLSKPHVKHFPLALFTHESIEHLEQVAQGPDGPKKVRETLLSCFDENDLGDRDGKLVSLLRGESRKKTRRVISASF